jgi:hypothetical protein
MTSEAARALFERALDGTLDANVQADFERTLAEDPTLSEEFAGLASLRRAARELSGQAPSVDLLGGVQAKLRARSGGKFYRDRFAERRDSGSVTWMLALASLVLIAVAGWLVLAGW